MKNKQFHKLLKKNQSNSGFTLTELLVGLIMGTIVVGGLGFGLVSLLRNTQTQTAFTGARNESARALDFVSDEVKRAVEIQADAANATGFDSAGKTVVFALDIPQVNTSATLGSDADAATPERIVYYLQAATDNWQGPQVLYRYGPPLNADGSYGTGDWDEEALIDGINDTPLAASAIQCGAGQDTTPATPTGFYACIQDDDLDAFVENDATADTNGDGEINAEDGSDTDNIGISAELYLTSGVDIGRRDGSDNKILQTYTANTQVVARARVAPGDNSEDFTSYTASYKTLGAVYGCNSDGSGTNWEMRTDFINNPANPDSGAGNRNTKWVHDETRQPQPINIDTTSNLTINSIPIGGSSCISKGGTNARMDGVVYDNESLTKEGLESVYYTDADGNYTNKDGSPLPSGTDPIFRDDSNYGDVYHKVSHTIDFDDPETYNGYTDNNNDVHVGNGSDSTVLFLRPGDVVPNNSGYDADNNAATTDNNQVSLRDFLADQGYLNSDFTVRGSADADPDSGNYISTNERIVIFEVGQTDTNHLGFDRQDNIFILSSDVFAKDASTP